jgi:hypothetical protein
VLDVVYSWEYVFQEVENTTESEKPQRVKLKKGSWEEGLIGVAKGCKRMIILPPILVVRSQMQRQEQKCCLVLQTHNSNNGKTYKLTEIAITSSGMGAEIKVDTSSKFW